MYRISVFLMLMFFAIASCGQSDDIVVKNIVEFYEYTDDNQETQDAVNFILEVTNHSDYPIPDLGATSRSEYVNLYINGKPDNPLNLYNGLELANSEKTIPVDSTQRFDSGGWILTANSGIYSKYGNEFTVQWEYNGIKSDIVKVNIQDKTIKRLNKNQNIPDQQ
ncbi:MAG: hypothetical protein PF590_01095 [Candidatus Delongbacteria bacterium]|nr:hypothetical protein [Candidatus Delongbacteria bacterium]